LKESQRLVKF